MFAAGRSDRLSFFLIACLIVGLFSPVRARQELFAGKLTLPDTPNFEVFHPGKASGKTYRRWSLDTAGQAGATSYLMVNSQKDVWVYLWHTKARPGDNRKTPSDLDKFVKTFEKALESNKAQVRSKKQVKYQDGVAAVFRFSHPNIKGKSATLVCFQPRGKTPREAYMMCIFHQPEAAGRVDQLVATFLKKVRTP